MPDVNTEFGARLRLARMRAGQTQAQLGSRVGLSRTSITNIELGRQGITLETLVGLAVAVGVEPAALVPAHPRKSQLASRLKGYKNLGEPDKEWMERVIAKAGGGEIPVGA